MLWSTFHHISLKLKMNHHKTTLGLLATILGWTWLVLHVKKNKGQSENFVISCMDWILRCQGLASTRICLWSQATMTSEKCWWDSRLNDWLHCPITQKWMQISQSNMILEGQMYSLSLLKSNDFLTESWLHKTIVFKIYLKNDYHQKYSEVIASIRKPDALIFVVWRKRLDPHKSTLICVKYTPCTVGMFSLDTYCISTPCGRQTFLKLQGKAIGSTVKLSSTALAFGDVEKGRKKSRVLYMENVSELCVPFQLMTDPLGTFSLDCARGILPPKTTIHVTITFQPEEESNYWKRITCLFQVQLEVPWAMAAQQSWFSVVSICSAMSAGRFSCNNWLDWELLFWQDTTTHLENAPCSELPCKNRICEWRIAQKGPGHVFNNSDCRAEGYESTIYTTTKEARFTTWSLWSLFSIEVCFGQSNPPRWNGIQWQWLLGAFFLSWKDGSCDSWHEWNQFWILLKGKLGGM